MKDWERFRIEGGSETEISTVRHIAHVPVAKRIIDDGQIQSGLIYDQSLLNSSRVSVVWLSANWWANGSMYGTVVFEFPWQEIVDGRNIYWVEAIDTYNPPAFRFLLSKRQHHSPNLQPYDPTCDDGPLRFRDGKWFRAGHFTSEFMIEEDISLNRCATLEFTEHHPRYCSAFGSACQDLVRPTSPQRTAAKMLAHLLTDSQHHVDTLWMPPGTPPGFTPLEMAYSGLWRTLAHHTNGYKGILRTPAACGPALIGALALYTSDRVQEARELVRLMNSREMFERTLLKTIRRHFKTPKWRPMW